MRGVAVEALKKNEEVVETLGERILGRVSLHDVYNPLSNEIIVKAGDEIDEALVELVEEFAFVELVVEFVDIYVLLHVCVCILNVLYIFFVGVGVGACIL